MTTEIASENGIALDIDATKKCTSAITELVISIVNYKRKIMLFTAIAMILGIAVSLILPVKYTSTTRIMPPQQAPSLSMMFMYSPTAGPSPAVLGTACSAGSIWNPIEFYSGLLSSKSIAD